MTEAVAALHEQRRVVTGGAVVTAAEARRRLAVPRSQFRRWLQVGTLRTVTGGHRFGVIEADVERLEEAKGMALSISGNAAPGSMR